MLVEHVCIQVTDLKNFNKYVIIDVWIVNMERMLWKISKALICKGYNLMGGGALSSKNVSKLGSKEVIRHAELVSASQSKEVSKKLRNFPFAIKEACH